MLYAVARQNWRLLVLKWQSYSSNISHHDIAYERGPTLNATIRYMAAEYSPTALSDSACWSH